MEESILDSIKQMLGVDPTDTSFDSDIMIHINSVFGILFQLGVGEEGFAISDNSTTWNDYLNGKIQLNPIKTYVFLKTKMYFDPPTVGTVANAYESQIAELEFRINVMVDPGDE